MKTTLLATAAALAASLLSAPASAQAGRQEVRVNQLIVYGNDPCPRSTEEEIVVCVKRPEGDRYRIPENLRDVDRPQNNSLANRALELQYVGRTGTESCSTVGPGGFTGCFAQLMNQARAERQNGDDVDWDALIEQARQQRLGRIDAEAEAVERDQAEPR